MSDSFVTTPRLLCPWDFPGKNLGVGFHFLLPFNQRAKKPPLSLVNCVHLGGQKTLLLSPFSVAWWSTVKQPGSGEVMLLSLG